MNPWSEYQWLRRVGVRPISAAYIAIRKWWYTRRARKIHKGRQSKVE